MARNSLVSSPLRWSSPGTRWREAGRPRRLGDQRVPGHDRRKGDDTSEFLAIRSP